jgi:hypothetical protein
LYSVSILFGRQINNTSIVDKIPLYLGGNNKLLDKKIIKFCSNRKGKQELAKGVLDGLWALN